jgi:DNA topoisomerase-1
MKFVRAAWWDIQATFDPALEATAAEPPSPGSDPGLPNGSPASFDAQLLAVDGRRIARGRDFRSDGQVRDEKLLVLDDLGASGLAERLDGAGFTVRSVERKPYVRRPSAPFMTSTLQQEASRKLRFTSQRTMQVAQRLYENGYITYMRTDSTTLSEAALTAARRQASELYGPDYVPDQPRRYERKVKNAQEAHEAIRPAGDTFRTPQQVERELGSDELRLYELIWIRTLASQMADAKGQTVSLRIVGTSSAGEEAEFGTSGTVITFRGFLAAYEEGRDEAPSNGGDRRDESERKLPNVSEGDPLTAVALEPQGHETTPPPRYTEASLVRALEERGIGRPSTYAAIIGTILDRGYVFKRDSALVPTFLAFAVVGLLEQHFGRLVDYDFTARMEDDLDRIAAGDEERVQWLRRFYFGDGDEGLKDLVSDLGGIDAREVSSIEIGDGIVVRVGRYGPYLERDGRRASVPPHIVPDELTVEKAEELLARPSDDRTLGVDPDTGREIVARTGRYGPYVTEVLEEGSKAKPRTASLFQTMSLESITLDDALRLLTIPRLLGTDPADGQEVVARNGRYGPYVQKDKESRSLDSEQQLLEISLEEALELLSKPKERRGRGTAAPPLRELGADPETQKPVVVKDGRFGPYVTDGEVNATIRGADTPETITLERASELLAERRAKGPSKPPKKRRTGGR